MHTDLPFLAVPPSVQLFHCLQQAGSRNELQKRLVWRLMFLRMDDHVSLGGLCGKMG